MFLFLLSSKRGKTNPLCQESGLGLHLRRNDYYWYICVLTLKYFIKNFFYFQINHCSTSIQLELQCDLGRLSIHWTTIVWTPILYQALGMYWWVKQTWSLPSLRQLRISWRKRQIIQYMNISISYIKHLQITEAWKYPKRWNGMWLMLGKAPNKRMRKVSALLLASYLAQSCCLLWV